ncbi:MAG: hypothetical protein LBC02_11650 [Planctomycetaceae bacterium]|nr:hypothetical protein [Planctomycetaceae bacterium]
MIKNAGNPLAPNYGTLFYYCRRDARVPTKLDLPHKPIGVAYNAATGEPDLWQRPVYKKNIRKKLFRLLKKV